jgi:hypothetical protein
MTQISPRHTREMADNFARLHRARDMAELRRCAVEITCAIGLVILTAAAGYLAHDQGSFTPCAPAISAD